MALPQDFEFLTFLAHLRILLFRQTEQPGTCGHRTFTRPGNYSRDQENLPVLKIPRILEKENFGCTETQWSILEAIFEREWTFLQRRYRHVLLRVDFANLILHMVCPSHLEEKFMANSHRETVHSVPAVRRSSFPWSSKTGLRILARKHAVG